VRRDDPDGVARLRKGNSFQSPKGGLVRASGTVGRGEQAGELGVEPASRAAARRSRAEPRSTGQLLIC